MANDPYRILGLAPGASLDEVKRAYRGLAKRHHPDTAGDAATSRFLAVQAAYEAIVGGQAGMAGRRGAPGSAARAAGRPSGRRAPPPDPTPGRASRGAYRRRGPAEDAGRPRRRSSGAAPGGSAGTSSTPGAGPSGDRGDTGGPTDRAGRRAPSRRKATLTSTSYDDASRESFEPDWNGGAWYGPSMGTYWTINPKEYADPRKHGAEYQARARRDAAAGGAAADVGAFAAGDAASAGPVSAEPAASGPVAAEPQTPSDRATAPPLDRPATAGAGDGPPSDEPAYDGTPHSRSRLPAAAADIVARIRRRAARTPP